MKTNKARISNPGVKKGLFNMKKKNGLVWYIVAGVFAISGLYALASGTSGGFITLIVAAVIAFIGYKKSSPAKKRRAANAKSAAAVSSISEGQRLFNEKHGVIDCSVAGVTFDNDDGSDRQKILRRLLNSDDANPDVTFLPYTFKKKPALYVMCGDQCVGNVPADYVEDVSSILDRIELAYITPDKFKNDDGVTIYRADLHIQYSK